MVNNRLLPVLFIERLSIISWFYSQVFKRRFKAVFYVHHDKLFSFINRISLLSNFLSSDLIKLEYSDFPGSYFEVEEEGYQCCIDSVYVYYSNNFFIHIARKFCCNDLFTIALKKEILNRYSMDRLKSHFFLTYIIKKNYPSSVYFVPENNQDFSRFLSKDMKIISKTKIPKIIRFSNFFKKIIKTILATIAFPIILLFVVLFYLKRGLLFSNTKKRYNYALDCYTYGINWKSPYQEFFIFDKSSFHPSKILHVIRGRFDNSENTKKSRDFYNLKGYEYVETDFIRVPAHYFFSTIFFKFFIKSLYYSICSSLSFEKDSDMLLSSVAIMKMKIESEIFYHSYDVKVFIARDEYSPYHIARTIAAWNSGNKTIGFSHGDSSHHSSAFNYFVFDRFAVWGDFFNRHFSKALKFSRTEIIGAGIYGMDKTFQQIKNDHVPAKYRLIRNKYSILTIWGSSFSHDLFITKELTLKFYETILNITEEKEEIFRIIKPKSDEFKDPDFFNLLKGRKRLILEDQMWTYRIIPVSDILICINSTTVGLEGLIAGKKVLYFDVTNNKQHNIYAKYHKDLVSFNESDLKIKLEKILADNQYLEGFDLDFIRKFHGYMFDGNVVKRFKSICISLLQETS